MLCKLKNMPSFYEKAVAVPPRDAIRNIHGIYGTFL